MHELHRAVLHDYLLLLEFGLDPGTFRVPTSLCVALASLKLDLSIEVTPICSDKVTDLQAFKSDVAG